MPHDPDQPAPTILSDHDAVFTLMRLLQRRPWTKSQSGTVDRVATQLVAEAITAALKAEGVTLSKVIPQSRQAAAWTTWPADTPPAEHPTD